MGVSVSPSVTEGGGTCHVLVVVVLLCRLTVAGRVWLPSASAEATAATPRPAARSRRARCWRFARRAKGRAGLVEEAGDGRAGLTKKRGDSNTRHRPVSAQPTESRIVPVTHRKRSAKQAKQDRCKMGLRIVYWWKTRISLCEHKNQQTNSTIDNNKPRTRPS